VKPNSHDSFFNENNKTHNLSPWNLFQTMRLLFLNHSPIASAALLTGFPGWVCTWCSQMPLPPSSESLHLNFRRWCSHRCRSLRGVLAAAAWSALPDVLHAPSASCSFLRRFSLVSPLFLGGQGPLFLLKAAASLQSLRPIMSASPARSVTHLQ